MVARLYRTILPVTNIDEATEFYRAVLGEPGQRVSAGRHYFGADGNGAVLACYDPQADGDGLGDGWHHHASQYVYFAVEDLDKTRKTCMHAGAKKITSVETKPWGETIFYALDPFDNPISFVQIGTEFTG